MLSGVLLKIASCFIIFMERLQIAERCLLLAEAPCFGNDVFYDGSSVDSRIIAEASCFGNDVF